MNKENLKSILVDYARYRKIKDREENRVKAINYETCRQNLNEVIKVLGMDVKYFKVNFVANQPFQFAEEDKLLLFEIFDRFTTEEFVLIRQGEFLKVPLDVLEFYIKSFTTILRHLDVDEEIINIQRELMEKYTNYDVAVEYNKTRKAITEINKDIEKIISYDDNLSYDDNIVFMNYVSKQMQLIQDQIRHVYKNMDEYRSHEGFMGEVNLIKQQSKEQRRRFKTELREHVELEQALRKNGRYMDLYENMQKILNEQSFLKNKKVELEPIAKEMTTISHELQMELFGRKIDDKTLYDEQKISRKISKEVLEDAIKSYNALLYFRSHNESDNPLIADMLCNELFSDNN
jgi:hypothetical protein